jgi:hypothetical protein
MIEGQSLAPTTEDIYFLTSLSRRGEPVNLRTFPLTLRTTFKCTIRPTLRR